MIPRPFDKGGVGPLSESESRALFESVAIALKDLDDKVVENLVEYAHKMFATDLDMRRDLGARHPKVVTDITAAGGDYKQVEEILKNLKDKNFTDDATRQALAELYKLLHQCRTAKK